MAESREESAGGQPERGDNVATHKPDSLGWGPVKDLGPDIVEGVLRIQGEGRDGPDRLGQFDADTGAARTRAR